MPAVVVVAPLGASHTPPGGHPKNCQIPFFDDVAETVRTPNLHVLLKNPDIHAGIDAGFVPASGRFYAQFEPTGGDAGLVDKIAFFFGVGVPGDGVCPVTAAALQHYRTDDVKEDGFMIPINTKNVPDNFYRAGINAYTCESRLDGVSNDDDGRQCQGQLLYSVIVDAQVLNGATTLGTAAGPIGPFPLVIPGDGSHLTDLSEYAQSEWGTISAAGKLTVDFGEPLTAMPTVTRAGVGAATCVAYDAPDRDNDAIPEFTRDEFAWGSLGTVDGSCVYNPALYTYDNDGDDANNDGIKDGSNPPVAATPQVVHPAITAGTSFTISATDTTGISATRTVVVGAGQS
ncbi:MAG: hypothetical protein ACT4PT_01740 [Methanobacteriota archaeon]